MLMKMKIQRWKILEMFKTLSIEKATKNINTNNPENTIDCTKSSSL